MEIAKLTREFEAKIEAKNEQLIAEIDKKANEENEKKMRDSLIESH